MLAKDNNRPLEEIETFNITCSVRRIEDAGYTQRVREKMKQSMTVQRGLTEENVHRKDLLLPTGEKEGTL